MILMPSRNITKQYIENGFYHLYNRGVEKRLIFQDSQDYPVFLSYLKQYLLPKNVDELTKKLADSKTPYKDKDKIIKLLRLNNFHEEITLLAYCLMPNHFHFLVKQKSLQTIDSFIQSLCTRYTMYFNRKYKRVGTLFQGTYKAVLVTSDEQLLYLSRYINNQSLALQGDTLQGLQGQPSSYLEYIGQRKTLWVKPEEILSFFSKTNPATSYESFVRQTEDFARIRKLLIEEDEI